ncbi:MAG TPA: hypothetical protein VFT95_03115 [Micromonosporaceae bacterium]|nr:hypothetical protein [Micromonosporaceae bacterium]
MNVLETSGADTGVPVEFRAPEPVAIPVRYAGHLAFAPDSSGLVVHPGMGELPMLDLYRLTGAGRGGVRRLPLRQDDGSQVLGVVHLGDAVVVQERVMPGGHRLSRTVRYRADGWTREVLLESTDPSDAVLAATPDGFVVGTERAFHHGGVDGPIESRTPGSWLGGGEATVHGADPVTGRLAVTVKRPDFTRELLLVEPDLTVAARTRIDDEQRRVDQAYFCGPDLVLTTGMWQSLRAYRADGDTLSRVGLTYFDKQKRMWLLHSAPLGITVVPSRRRVAVEMDGEAPMWLDADTLESVPAPRAYGTRLPLWISPDERYVVFEQDLHELELFDAVRFEIAELLHRPLAELGRADDERISMLRRMDPSPRTGAVLDMIRAHIA